MFKVFTFLKRNARLTHDEYRMAHVGYHCRTSRRLRGIRGYTVNVWANEPLNPRLGALTAQLDALESELLASTWYREVDETVAVNPNRGPAPAFYFP